VKCCYQGHRIYFGPVTGAPAFFADAGLPVPPLWSPTDHFIEVVSRRDSVAALKAHAAATAADDSAPSIAITHHGARARQEAPPLWRQVAVLSRRGFATARGRLLTPLEFFLSIGLAVVWGCLWFGVGRGSDAHKAQHAEDVVAVVFFVASQWSWGMPNPRLSAFTPSLSPPHCFLFVSLLRVCSVASLNVFMAVPHLRQALLFSNWVHSPRTEMFL
jgi:hypothetical protein